MKPSPACLLAAVVAILSISLPGARAWDSEPKWPAAVEEALAKAGENRAELVKALRNVPKEQASGMEFLIANMPEVDLRRLKADYLLENSALAYAGADAAPWGSQIPEEIFLNDVLPYASLNERRDAWRSRLRTISLPLVEGCRTPGEAAQALNKKLFPLVKVRYSTERKKPDQSALETLESGIATCSGLSILLVDACRSVGVPARIAGIPMWANLRGNHTWVEVWDGEWHFLGAAEPDEKGLDHAWFTEDAARAKVDVPEHSIYASSFRKTGLSFPLVWNPRLDWVPAVNVTARYTAPAAPKVSKVRLLVRVLDRPGGKRVPVKVSVSDPADPALHLEGMSRDESADLNNFLQFELERGHAYRLRLEQDGKGREVSFKTTSGSEAEQLITLTPAE